jgi:hypothetical protein
VPLQDPERQELRRPVIVSIVGTPGRILHGEIRNLNSGETQVWFDPPLDYSSLVIIDDNDKRLLGEVTYCEQKLDGWLVGIRIEHVLLGQAPVHDAKK